MLVGDAMLTWTDAHRIANIAAAQAHYDLGVDPGVPPIDVATALAANNVPLMWRPMPRLFGAYLNSANSRPGVLVNSAIPVGARRHTAAHELGHHRLRHSATIEDGACLHLDPLETAMAPPVPGRLRWTDQEKSAEAFAAWFLMPRRAVLSAMGTLGLTRLETATQIYRLSLILGTSYRSTVRHLPNLRLASQERSRSWMAEAPGRIKAQLDPTRTWQGRGITDLWTIDQRFNGSRVRLQHGDQLVAITNRTEDLAVTGDACLAELTPVAGAEGITWRSWLATDALQQVDGIATITALHKHVRASLASPTWTVSVVVEAPPLGLDRAGLEPMEPPR